MTALESPDDPEIVLTAAQWRRIQAMVRAAERLNPEPDTGEPEPPTWENT